MVICFAYHQQDIFMGVSDPIQQVRPLHHSARCKDSLTSLKYCRTLQIYNFRFITVPFNGTTYRNFHLRMYVQDIQWLFNLPVWHFPISKHAIHGHDLH